MTPKAFHGYFRRTTMNRRIFCMICLLVTLVTAADVRAEPPDNLKKLKEKRLALLVKIHEATKERQRIDPALDAIRNTMVDVLAARLDLAETKEDRIKVLEDAVKYAEQWEKAVKEMVKGGFAASIDLLKAEAYVLEARIALEKIKAAGKGKKSD